MRNIDWRRAEAAAIVDDDLSMLASESGPVQTHFSSGYSPSQSGASAKTQGRVARPIRRFHRVL